MRIIGEPIPEYDLALIFIGPLVLGAIWLLFHRTRWGILVRAATQDRDMVDALGVNQAWLFSGVFMLGGRACRSWRGRCKSRAKRQTCTWTCRSLARLSWSW